MPNADHHDAPSLFGPARVIGLLLLAHVVLLAALKVSRGIEGEMAWVSHVSLGLGGVALLVGEAWLARVSVALVAVLHTIWLGDAVWGLTTGVFPLAMTGYLADADALTLLGTSHHLYLVPLLWVWLRAHPSVPGETARVALWTVLVAVGLTLVARRLIPARLNVNFAHALLPASESPAFVWFNALPAPAYLSIHLGVLTLAGLLPGVLLASRIGGVLMHPNDRPAHDDARAARALSGGGHRPRSATRSVRAGAFTLVELIAVIVVLSILSAAVIPRYFDHAQRARESAAEGSIAGIKTALHGAFLDHRLSGAGSDAWITSVNQIPALMETGQLPSGMKIVGARIEDQNENQFNLTPETGEEPARLTVVVAGGAS